MIKKVLPKYTLGEELTNSISHGIGAGLSIAALVLCVVRAAINIETVKAMGVVAAAIYGSTLIILYCMSTLYHAITNKTARTVFRIFDHTSIYLLIAGTYTPITLITLRGAIGWVLFGIVWGVAVLGITLNAISIEKFRKFSIISYILMGWAVVFGGKPVIEQLPKGGLIFLLIGGAAYTIGIIFYALKKVKYMHSIWHFFVLAGSITHFFAIYLYVLK
ncbi:MAG: hemolysin III family protein [Ruminococcaceae bacterium]|nr:hemolysin III family protein [Oscillospiraceae bacterium]